MLGRLARYLRFVGCDTIYGRGLPDEALTALAHRDGRVLLTRDRALSARTPGAFLVSSPRLSEQWRQVRARWPEIPAVPSFDRCTLCNGELQRQAGPPAPDRGGMPPEVRRGEAPLYVCRDCGHAYWDGSHTRRIRERLEAWGRGVDS
jgi:uncharacterized protein